MPQIRRSSQRERGRALLLVAICGLAAAELAAGAPLALTRYTIVYNETEGPYLLGVWTVPGNFINTGLAYDPENHLLYCSHLEFSMQGECVETLRKADGARLAPPIPVNVFSALVQGLAYDAADSTFWIWGGPGPYAEKRASHFDRRGVELPGSFLLPGYPGMLDLDSDRGLLVSKANLERMVNFYDDAGAIVDSFDAGYGGEGIARDPFDGTWWVLTESQLHHIRRAGASSVLLGSYPNPSRYYPPDVKAGYLEDGEAEGIAVDRSDRTLWLNADQGYHGGIPNGNRTWHVDPLRTYNKSIHIPHGLVWSRGHRTHTMVEDGVLVIEPGFEAGEFLAPIVDLLGYTPLADSVLSTGTGTVLVSYRGADEAPSTPPITNLTLPYYDANSPGGGWGVTLAGPWQASIPAHRYIQVRFSLLAAGAGIEDDAELIVSSQSLLPRIRVMPNPFRHEAAIEVLTASGGPLVVIDAAGRRVRELACGRGAGQVPGALTASWDGTDDVGRPLPRGVYFLAIDGERPRDAVRAVLLR